MHLVLPREQDYHKAVFKNTETPTVKQYPFVMFIELETWIKNTSLSSFISVMLRTRCKFV